MLQLPAIAAYKQPILRALIASGGSAANNDLQTAIIEAFGLTAEQVARPHNTRKGKRTELAYRMAWARTKLKDAGLIERAGSQRWSITPAGRAATASGD